MRLTRRERDVAQFVARGLANPEIADRLGLTKGTVKVYLSRMYEKLGFRGGGDNRVRLALYYLQTAVYE